MWPLLTAMWRAVYNETHCIRPNFLAQIMFDQKIQSFHLTTLISGIEVGSGCRKNLHNSRFISKSGVMNGTIAVLVLDFQFRLVTQQSTNDLLGFQADKNVSPLVSVDPVCRNAQQLFSLVCLRKNKFKS